MNLKKEISDGNFDKIVNQLEGVASSPEEFVALGVSYYHLGNKNKALSSFKKAIQLDSKNVDVFFNLSEVLL
jgi:cytochrome c-type biogenesis protein CcmH/NrfG